MTRMWKLFAVTATLALAFAFISLDRTAASAATNGEAAAFSASTFFNERCTACHGQDGRPKRPGVPDFSNPDFQTSHTDEQIQASIVNGRMPRMPPFKSKLDEEQAKALVAHVRSFGAK